MQQNAFFEFTLPAAISVIGAVLSVIRIVLPILAFTVFACSSTGKRGELTTPSGTVLAAPDNTAGTGADDEAESDAEMPVSDDPWEGFNRKMHVFNEFFLHYMIQPVARGWAFITPTFMREGLSNFFHWAYTPGRLVNNLLQAKFRGAAKETAGFVINATAGGLGFYDASRDIFGLERSNEDTDQTLGKWGLPEGPYVVWPFIGPHTARGTFGFVGDLFLQPQTVVVPVYIKPKTIWVEGLIIAGVYSFRAVNATSLSPDAYDDLVKDSIDPYAFIRDIYLQNTRKNVAD